MKAAGILDRVLSADMCAGCGLCESIAGSGTVQLTVNATGFPRPRVLRPLSAEVDKVIADTCPGSRVRSPGGEAAGRFHTVWGRYHSLRVAYATDGHTRHLGSSGGVLTALLVHLLKTGEVDYVVQVGADAKHPLVNATMISRTPEEVIACAGSRYAPSSPLRELHQYLSAPGRFAFVGKPCDVDALRRYGLHDRRVSAKVRLALSFFCAGVPSTNATRSLVKAMGSEPDAVQSFRYRGAGWPGSATAVDHDGTVHTMSYHDSWGGVLSRELQTRCKLCPDGIGELADLVCADPWESDEKGYPLFTERAGESLLISRTVAGEEFVKRCLSDGAIALADRQVSVEQIKLMQPYQYDRKTLLLARLLALILRRRFVPDFEKSRMIRAAFLQPLRRFVSNFIGTWKRLKRADVEPAGGAEGESATTDSR